MIAATLHCAAMEQLQTCDRVTDKEKVCWFPFKNAYTRRRIKPGFCDPPNAFIMDSKNGDGMDPVEVSLYEIKETDQQPPRVGEIYDWHPDPLELRKAPSDMDTTEINSIVSEEDDIIIGDVESQLASINPNCLSKEFWVDEMVDGGSLACTDDFFSSRRLFKRTDRSSSSHGSQTLTISSTFGADSRLSDDLSFARVPTPVAKARIEVEYNFSKRDLSFTSEKVMDPIERGTCGAIRGRSKPHPLTAKAKSSAGSEASSVSNSFSPPEHILRRDVSNASSSTALIAVKKVPIHSESQSTPACAKEISPAKLALKPVDPPLMEPISRRLLCGAMATQSCQLAKTRDRDETIEEEKKTEDPPASAAPVGPDQDLVPPRTQSLSGPTSWLRNSSFDPLQMQQYTKSLYPKACPMALRPEGAHFANRADTSEPHFFVEVEATERQLREIRDLEELNELNQDENPISPISFLKELKKVDVTRTASLVDEDSAFMQNDCAVDMFKKFSPKRLSAARKEDPIPTKMQYDTIELEERISSATTLPRGKTSIASRESPPGSKVKSGSSGTDRKMPSRRVGHSSLLTSSTEFGPRQKDTRSALEGPVPSLKTNDYDPQESPRVAWRAKDPMPFKTNNRVQVVQSGAADTSKDMEWLDQSPIKRTTRPPSTRALDQDASQRVRSAEGKPSKKRNQIDPTRKFKDTDLTAEVGQGESDDFSHDFELARFPSLSSEDWRKTELEQIQVTRLSSRIGSRENESTWIPRDRDYDFSRRSSHNGHEFGQHFDPNSELLRLDNHMGAGGANSHDFGKAPSLAESFHHAVPFVPDTSNTDDNYEHRNVSDSAGEVGVSSRSHSSSRGRGWNGDESPRSPRSTTANNGVRSSWSNEDYDDESELNTEAFRRLAMEEGDDDSIFNGLVERSPTGYQKNGRERDGPPLHFEMKPRRITSTPAVEDASHGSISLENSLEQSNYTSYTTGAFSIHSKYSRRSVLSRDEMTSYTDAHSVVNEPFNCMDKWLD